MKTTIHKFRMAVALMVLLACTIQGCEDFIAIDLPNTKLTAQGVFENDGTATAGTLSMYEVMMRTGSFSASGAPGSVACLAGVYSDELTNFNSGNTAFAQNELVASHSAVLSLWASAYTTIFSANAALEGLAQGNVTEPLKKQLQGEAYFVRAFCFFYLTNMFGDIPLVTTTDYRSNAIMARSPKEIVYTQIVADLQMAEQLLSPIYVTAERARPSLWSARALLARVRLYQGEWSQAESLASSIIQNEELFLLEPDLEKVFPKESREAIWQLCSTTPSSLNTYEGYYFILTAPPQSATMSDTLMNSFEVNDQRKIAWVGNFSSEGITWFYPYKYKMKDGSSPLVEHSVILRLAEQYLIRAEARAHQGKLLGADGAATDLNAIRERAGLDPTTATTETEILAAIEAERKVELFAEWGHRWFDLKRNGRAAEVLGAMKPSWNMEDELFPVPETEIITNGNLEPQNPGY